MNHLPSVVRAAMLSATALFSSIAIAADTQIQEVLVSASLLPINASRSANAVTLIDRQQLKNRAALSVSDLLRDVPGLAVSRSGVLGSQTQIRVRGAEANHLLVLIDGVEANDPSQSDELDWGTLTASDIERIEVIRGPQSALHGSDAIAGVINIITRSADRPFSAKLFSEIGSWSTYNNGLSIGHKSADFAIRFGLSHLESDGDNIARTGDEKDGYRNTKVNVKAGLALSDQWHLSVAAHRVDGVSEFDADNDYDGMIEDRDRASEFRNSTALIEANYASDDGRWQHKLMVAQSKHDNQAFADGVRGNVTAASKDQYRYTGSLLWGDTQSLSLLLEREQEHYHQRGPISWGLDPNQDRQRDTDSLAVEYRTTVSGDVTIAVSGRVDNNAEFDDAETFRVEAVYQLNDRVRLRSAYGTAIKNPTFAERFGFYTNFIGNPDLEPEASSSWELGIDQQIAAGDFTWSATLFDTELEDEIDGFVYDPLRFAYTSGNKAGKSQRQGVELAVFGALSDRVSANAQYTYTDSVESDGAGGYVDEARRARHIASFNVAWQAMDKLMINTNIQYNGSQSDVFFPPWPATVQTVKLADYTLVNINAHYSVSEKLALYLRLDNLFNDDYEQVYGYQTLGFGASFGFRYGL